MQKHIFDGELAAYEFQIVDLPLTEEGVVGFELQFDYQEPASDASWASDLQLKVEPL